MKIARDEPGQTGLTSRDAAHWFEQFADVSLMQFVFVDELGATTDMTRAYARPPITSRLWHAD